MAPSASGPCTPSSWIWVDGAPPSQQGWHRVLGRQSSQLLGRVWGQASPSGPGWALPVGLTHPVLGTRLHACPPSPCTPRFSLLMSADLWLSDPGLLSPHNWPRPLVPGLLPHSACVRAKPLQLCPILCNPMDCSPPGSSVHGFSRQEDWGGLP